jgi:hypothetical protein
VRPTKSAQPVASGLHPHASGVTGSFSGAVQEVKPERRVTCGNFPGTRLSAVGAAVQDEQDLVLLVGHPFLLGERPQARSDELLLVSGGDDDADAECRVRRWQRHRGKEAPDSIRPRPSS